VRSLPAVVARAARVSPPESVLPAAYRLRSSREFDETIRLGRRAGSTTLVVHAQHSVLPGNARAGLVVSRAVGGAVIRNRVKRRLRHLLRARLETLPAGTRLVLRALATAATAPTSVLARDLDFCLSRLDSGIA